MDLLSSVVRTAITIGIFVLLLGCLVIVHEIGHFVAARLAGVRVLEFGLGFPPRARVLRSKGETLVTLNWLLPLGGFVRLEGEDADTDDPRSFFRARLPVKLFILLAGALMNAVLAVVIFSAIAWTPGQTAGLGFQTTVPGSPAAAIGLVGIGSGTVDTPSDTIVAVDGQRFHDFEGAGRLSAALRARAGQAVHLTVVRADGTVAELAVTLQPPFRDGKEQPALGIAGIFDRPVAQSFTRDPVAAVGFGVAQTGEAFGLIGDGLASVGNSIVNRPTQDPGVAGPIGIAVGVGDVFWTRGIIATVQLAALLSANLALVNLIPLPPLDGGRMLLSVIRASIGRRYALRVEQVTTVVGFLFLMAFLLWVSFFDITRQAMSGQ